MIEQKQGLISIDDKDYLLEELSEEAKAEIQSLQFCESEIARLNAQLAVVATARIAYRKALAELLPGEGIKH
jgi:hypothetical protein